eukprot:Opistho-2@43249
MHPQACVRLFARREEYFWSYVTVTLAKPDVKRARGGISFTSVAPSGNVVAVATLSGDMYIYDCGRRAQQMPAAMAHGVKVTQKAETDAVGVVGWLSWSYDGTRLVGVDDQGRLHVWILSALNDAVDINTGEPVQAMKPSWTFAPADLVFAKGPFATCKTGPRTLADRDERQDDDIGARTTDSARPVQAVFFPSLTLLGGQHSVVVCMSTGDILKLNFPGATASAYVPIIPVTPDLRSEVAFGVGVELFRGHNQPVTSVAFPGRAATMVTVDAGGHLMVWDYAAANVSGFGWFVPSRQVRVEFAVTRYEKLGNPLALFTDARKTGLRLHGRTKAEVKKERSDAEARIARMRLGNPYHVTQGKSKSQEYTYAPSTVPTEGAEFHIITRAQDRLLISHMTQRHVPVKHHAAVILDARVSPNDDHMVFLALFAEHGQKAPHLSICSVNLTAVKLGHIRIDVPITDAEFKKYRANPGLCSIEVSSVIDVMRSDYVYLAVSGSVSLYSLMTGVRVKVVSVGKLPQMARLAVSRDCGALFVTSKTSSNLFTVFFADGNGPTLRRRMYHTLAPEERKRGCPAELAIRMPPPKSNPHGLHEGWAPAGTAQRHIARIVGDIIDAALLQSSSSSSTSREKGGKKGGGRNSQSSTTSKASKASRKSRSNDGTLRGDG